MLNVQTSRGIFRRYIFWLKYDGSRFNEMATSPQGFGIIDTFNRCLDQAINLPDIRVTPSSRTDSNVHALRTSVLAHIPLGENGALDETPAIKENNLLKMNDLLRSVKQHALKILDFHSVSPGFCSRKHVAYRHYAYRIVVPKSLELCYPNKPSLPLISEKPYSWVLTPKFDVDRAAAACRKLEGHHNVASFFKHTLRERKLDKNENTMKYLQHVGITSGSAYSLPSSNFDYFVIHFISRAFVREQIRRMMAVIVAHGNNRIELRDIDWLLTRPDPVNFLSFKNMRAAPPNGLFLANVVYDPKMYLNPEPYVTHYWDFDFDEKDDQEIVVF